MMIKLLYKKIFRKVFLFIQYHFGIYGRKCSLQNIFYASKIVFKLFLQLSKAF